MIEEFKDILEKYFEKTGKIIDRNKIVVTRYEEIDGYVIGFLHLSFLILVFIKLFIIKILMNLFLKNIK